LIAPVGGGNGGIFAQAYRYQQSPPDSAPYSGGPVTENTAATPFNTLNAFESVGGLDSFTLNATKTETIDDSGNIASRSDTHTCTESGNDTSSLSDIGIDSANDGAERTGSAY
jgi:hypothetical protein